MSIRELLGYQKGALEQMDVQGGTLEGVWSMIAGGAHQQSNTIWNPIIQVFHCAKGFLGRMRETKIINMEVNWLESALIAKQPIDPTHLMINQWCCEATLDSRDIGSGCYISMLAISLRPGITRNPKHLLSGTSLRLYEARQEHKWRREKRLQSGQSKFAPIGWKIKTFC
jgi:hypothetical protein